MQSLLLKIGSIVRGQIYIDRGYSIKNTILLCGSGRSGTTWVASIINSDNHFRYMFEPFHPELVPMVKHFNVRQYLRPSNKEDKFVVPATNIFSGKVRNLWVDRYNRNIFPRKRLIKDIRINLILKWIRINFPQMPIIYMLRHPFAVACSRIRLGWKNHLKDLLKQKELIDDLLYKFESLIDGRRIGEFEKQIIFWCIENYYPMTSFKPGEIYILFYENLYLNPEGEIKGLFNYIGLPIPESVPKKIRKPSSMTKKDSPLVTGRDPLLHWKDDLDNRQIDRALRIMSEFGFDKVYTDGALPTTEGVDELVR